jgi:type I restriction enzyme S subunit
MDSKAFFDNFEIIADAPGGIAHLRELILDLAVLGKLVPQTADWQECLLGEITKIRTGKLDANASSSDGRYPFFTCARDPLRIDSFSYDTECVLLAGNGNFDVNYYSGKFDAYQRTYIIEALDEKQLFVPFLFRFMQGHSRKLLDQAIGGVIRYIKIGFLTQAPFLLPSLEEQKRIVAKVDELMTLCDELEAAQNQRNSVRTAACKSAIDSTSISTNLEELEDAWRRISKNWITIADTPESISSLRSLILDLAIHGLLSDPNVKFETVSMGDIFDVSGGLQKTPKRTPVRSHFPYLRVANVQRGRLDLAEISRFELSNDELERYKLSPRDLLIVEGNGSEKEIGRCALWNGEIQDCIHQNHIIRCRPNLPEVEKYALLFLNSPSGTRLMKSLAVTTSGLFTLSVGKIRAIEFRIPPVSEILTIVRKVDELTTLCDEANNTLLKRNLLGESLAKTMTRVVNT